MTPYYQDDAVIIYHGDSRDWMPPVDVIVTDPPYGIAYASARGGKFEGVGVAADWDTTVRDAVLARWADLPGNRPALVFGSWKATRPAATRLVLTWDKGDHVGMGDLDTPWKPNTEEVYVIGRGFIGHRGSSVLRYNAPSPNFTPDALRAHPTEKPVALMRALVAKCDPEWTVLDPFMGSGTTLRAAKDLNRRAIGIEVDERYCEIAANRCRQEVLGLVG